MTFIHNIQVPCGNPYRVKFLYSGTNNDIRLFYDGRPRLSYYLQINRKSSGSACASHTTPVGGRVRSQSSLRKSRVQWACVSISIPPFSPLKHTLVTKPAFEIKYPPHKKAEVAELAYALRQA